MRKILLTSVLVCFVFSAFADDPVYITDGSKCTNATTGTTGGNISLRTVYQPKSIPITWESNGTTYTTSTCTYDTQLQMPVAPTRLGYTFDGWTLEEACSLSNLDTSIGADRYACLDLNGNGACISGVDNGMVANASLYGLDTPGQLAVPFSYGTVFGMAKCSAKNGDNHGKAWGGNSADWTSDATTLDSTTGDARYCWCRATGYIANGAEQCSLSSPAWVFSGDEYSAAYCAHSCAYNCGSAVQYEPVFRAALFGDSSSGSGSSQACLIPSTDVSKDGSSQGHKNDSTGELGEWNENTSEYGLREDNTWGVTWSNGDKVVGEALCSQTSGTWATTGTPDTTGTGNTKYCWCRATAYTPSGGNQCQLSSPAWVFGDGSDSAANCAHICASYCANVVRNPSDFRVALFGAAQ